MNSFKEKFFSNQKKIFPDLDYKGDELNYLDYHEKILWEGRPATQYKMTREGDFGVFLKVIVVSVGILVLMFLLNSELYSVNGGPPDNKSWLYGVIFAVLLWAFYPHIRAFGPYIWSVCKRKYTRYVLTNRRAIIVKKLWIVHSMKSIPITEEMPIEIRSGEVSTLLFERETQTDEDGTVIKEHAFENVLGVESILKRIRKIQNGEYLDQEVKPKEDAVQENHSDDLMDEIVNKGTAKNILKW